MEGAKYFRIYGLAIVANPSATIVYTNTAGNQRQRHAVPRAMVYGCEGPRRESSQCGPRASALGSVAAVSGGGYRVN